MQITKETFNRLPQAEREEWLAYDDWKHRQRLKMLRSMNELVSENKSIDGGGYVAVWLSLLED